jgi:hypothetical protein
MALNNSKQSNLEAKAAVERMTEMSRSDYNYHSEYQKSEDVFSHPDDKEKVLGKGFSPDEGYSGHGHYVPDYTKSSTSPNYSNFRTDAGGGYYDINGRNEQGGRNRLLSINIYNKENPYSAESVDITDSSEQYVFNKYSHS